MKNCSRGDAARRLDCPDFRRALETGQTKRRIIQTYTVAHSTGISEALRSLRVWVRICAPARSVHSGFRNARSVRERFSVEDARTKT